MVVLLLPVSASRQIRLSLITRARKRCTARSRATLTAVNNEHQVIIRVDFMVLPFSAVIHREAKNLQRNICARDQERDLAISVASCVLKECGRRRCAGGFG
jgi:hypothetical protein